MFLFFHMILNLGLVLSSSFLPFHCHFPSSKNNNNLMIDKISFRHNLKFAHEDNFIVIFKSNRSTNKRALRTLYEIVETENLSISSEYLMKCVNEIFEKSLIYCYSPVQWAILQDKLEILDHFVQESLLKHAKPYRVNFELKKLLEITIKAGKFKAFKFLRSFYNKTLKYRGLLDLAVQHRVSEEFLDYLLYYCGLASEVTESTDQFIKEPIFTAIKFNNINASLKFIRSRGRFPHALLLYIMLYNRIRLLTTLFEEFEPESEAEPEAFSFDCEYKYYGEEDGYGNLLHLAAKYANEPEMVRFLLKKCPNIPIDELNGQGKTALEISLKFLSINKQKIAEILILNGADIFLNSSLGICPLEIIISGRLTNVFRFILEIWMKRRSNLQFIIDKIFLFRSWSMLDQVLLLFSSAHDLTINFNIIPLTGIIEEKAHVTLDHLIETGFVELDEELIDFLILSGSVEMVRVALNRGISPEHIRKVCDMKRSRIMISENAYESILSLIN